MTKRLLKKSDLTAVFLFFCCLFFGGTPLQAEQLDRFEVGLQGGYRFDELDWNTAGDLTGRNPNVLSELTWEDLQTFQVQTNGQMVASNRDFPVGMKLRWLAGYGFILNGDNQDSDYAGDNRTLEFSRSNNSGDDGSMVDLSVGVGPHFMALDQRVQLSLLLGVSYHEQNLTITDGNQTVDTIAPVDLGPFSGLDSTFETQWWGPWLGVDLEFRPAASLVVTGLFEFHFAEYEAEADWNLRGDLQHPVSFAQWGDNDYLGPADGYGMVAGLGLTFYLQEHLAICLDGRYQTWKIRNGIDSMYFADGTVSSARLNEVNWESASAFLGLVYRFK